jgi:hypothetical protein
MFRPNRPYSDGQVIVIKESARHCKAVLFFSFGSPELLLVMWEVLRGNDIIPLLLRA